MKLARYSLAVDEHLFHNETLRPSAGPSLPTFLFVFAEILS